MSGHRDAERLLRQGRYQEAKTLFVQLSARDPAAAQFGLGRIALARHRFVRAEKHFWDALRRDGKNADLRNWIAACRLGRGDAEGALELADAAQRSGAVGPLNSLCRARAMAAMGKFEAGQIERAEQLLKTAVAADPSAVTLQFLYAELLLRTERFGELQERIEFLEALAAHSAAWLLEIGALHAELGDASTAMARFTAALEAEPEHPEALYRIGGYAEAKGDFAAAVDFYQRAIIQDPRHQQARARLDVLSQRSPVLTT